jgi:hypothetical protein
MGPIKRQIMASVLASCFAGAATRAIVVSFSAMATALSAANDVAATAMSAEPIQVEMRSNSLCMMCSPKPA